MIRMIQADAFFNMLSDSTRLRTLMLILGEGEVCVCEITHALGESQPKVSRHLALMRDHGIVDSRREGIWMYYRMHPELPDWAKNVMETVSQSLLELQLYQRDKQKLGQMKNRPEKMCV